MKANVTTRRGTVVSWKRDWGFIEPEDGGPDVFVHFSGISSTQTFKKLQQDQFVEFDTEMGRKGPEARNVKVVQP
jgi:CspA family cold shock protein